MLALSRDGHGETGIGQMILFIAMILVSAVAAGLFIQTMSDLQQQAQETGNQALIDVSTGLSIVTATGDRDENASGDNSDHLERIRLTVELQPGSKPIDMENVVIQLTTESDMTELTYAATVDESHFSAIEIRDPEETWSATEKIISSGALIQVIIDPDYTGLDMLVTAGDTMEIRIIPVHGSPTVLRATTPSVFASRFVDLK
jgi:flagellin FlaB